MQHPTTEHNVKRPEQLAHPIISCSTDQTTPGKRDKRQPEYNARSCAELYERVSNQIHRMAKCVPDETACQCVS